MYRLYYQTNSPYTMNSGVNTSKGSLLPIFIAGAISHDHSIAQGGGCDTCMLVPPNFLKNMVNFSPYSIIRIKNLSFQEPMCLNIL